MEERMEITQEMIDRAIADVPASWDFSRGQKINVPIRVPMTTFWRPDISPERSHPFPVAEIEIEDGYIDHDRVQRWRVRIRGEHTGVTEYVSHPWLVGKSASR
jgi:hypothetical protein